MSQVSFRAVYGRTPVEVMAGWDHPLQRFYLTLFDAGLDGSDEDAEETVWSTLDHPDPEDAQSTTRLRAKLKEMGIGHPDEFWTRVELREGNVQHTFFKENWVKRQL